MFLEEDFLSKLQLSYSCVTMKFKELFTFLEGDLLEVLIYSQ